jgi:2-polyprenyl-3-methyl-5-hydroxy-6-metoxy-1,4-benzoquinol methylase
MSETKFNQSAEYFRGHRAEVADLVPQSCTRILDVGCGFGGLGRELRARGFESLTGIELNPSAESNLSGVYDQFWIGDVEAFHLPEGVDFFDCIVFADVLEHLRDPWETLSRYIKWLKPGGVVVASIPNVRNMALLYNLIVRGRWEYQESGILDRTHLRFFTRIEIGKMFENAGLKIECVSENREQFSLLRRVFAAPLLTAMPDLGVCQFLLRASRR